MCKFAESESNCNSSERSSRFLAHQYQSPASHITPNHPAQDQICDKSRRRADNSRSAFRQEVTFVQTPQNLQTVKYNLGSTTLWAAASATSRRATTNLNWFTLAGRKPCSSVNKKCSTSCFRRRCSQHICSIWGVGWGHAWSVDHSGFRLPLTPLDRLPLQLFAGRTETTSGWIEIVCRKKAPKMLEVP